MYTDIKPGITSTVDTYGRERGIMDDKIIFYKCDGCLHKKICKYEKDFKKLHDKAAGVIEEEKTTGNDSVGYIATMDIYCKHYFPIGPAVK